MNFMLNDTFFRKFGSTWELDGIYLFLVTPTGTVGLLLNLISFIVIYKIKTKQKNVIYNHLKIYCINSFLVCLIASDSFYVYAPRYVGLLIDRWARLFKCYGMIYLALTFYLFGNLLDIVISIDRLSIFISKLKHFNHPNPYITCLILFASSCLINIPTALSVYFKDDQEINNDLLISVANDTDFSVCGSGILFGNAIFIGVNIFFRDIVTLILEIIFSILILLNYKRFQSMKIKLRKQSTLQTTQNNNNNLSQEKKLTRMTLYLSIISIITHISIFITFIFFIFLSDYIIGKYIQLVGIYSITIKHCLNFFIFYKFDSNFRSNLYGILNYKNKKVNGNVQT
jgi:hypothetical protein